VKKRSGSKFLSDMKKASGGRGIESGHLIKLIKAFLIVVAISAVIFVVVILFTG